MWMFLFSLITAEAMPNVEFSQLTTTLDHASFSSDQLRILQSLPNNTSLTMSQGIGILEEFSFANDQIKALRIIAPYIHEREQQYMLIETFTFSSDKSTATSILAQIPPSKQIQKEAHSSAAIREELRKRQKGTKKSDKENNYPLFETKQKK